MLKILSKIKLPAREKFNVGLDIGTHSIKCVKLKINGDDAELIAFNSEEAQLDPVETLKKIRQEQEADLVNISFCGSSTVIRYVNFLKMNKAELKQALKFEAQKHIPFSLNDVSLDAEILRGELPENKMLVLIAAVKKELIQQRIKIMEISGFRANIIDIDSLALVNAFNYNYPKAEVSDNKSVCLLNIGANISNVNILNNGIPVLSRDIHSGGASFTKKLMDIFSIDFKEAEKLKINPEGESANKVKAAVESVLTNLAAEIRTSFDYYESQNTSNVVKIYLSGGTAKTPGLSEMLSACLGIQVEFWDPFKKIKISEKIDKPSLSQMAVQFNVAIGLALRS